MAEAKERLTYAEVLAWDAYRQKYGTLHVGMRLEIGFGQVLAMVCNALGGKTDPRDFMPHVPKPAPEPLSAARIMAVLGAVAPVKQTDAQTSI